MIKLFHVYSIKKTIWEVFAFFLRVRKDKADTALISVRKSEATARRLKPGGDMLRTKANPPTSNSQVH